MFIIEAKSPTSQWISGIFKDKTKADRYFSKISIEKNSIYELKEIPIQDYPFFIIEPVGKEEVAGIRDAFIFTNEIRTIMMFLSRIKSGADQNLENDRAYMIIYRIKKDFEPKIPGKDEMGILDHLHVNNQTLNEIKNKGLDTLF